MTARVSWTPEEDAALLAAYSDPSPDAVRRIAQSLGRGYDATRVRAHKIGARRRDAQGEKIKSGYFKALDVPVAAADPIHDAFKAWRPPVLDA